jgi:hypothetical protein
MVNLTPEGNLTKEEFLKFYDNLDINIPGDLALKAYVDVKLQPRNRAKSS